MKLELFYRTIITDAKGKIVKRSRWRKSRSFVIGFLQQIDALCNHAYNVAGITVAIIDVGNVSRNIVMDTAYSQTKFAIFAPDNTSGYGIVVGTGTTAPTNSDYTLAAQIAHGVGTGQLDYGTHSRTASQVVAGNVDFVISRTFYNGSGASITVKEIGVYTCWGGNYFCVIRDVITDVAVADTQTLTVQYTLRTTV